MNKPLTQDDLQRLRADAQRGMGASSEATLQLVAMTENLEADLGLLNIKLDEISKQPTDQAAAGNDEPLTCDYCGAETDNPWHGSGILNGKESRHIHACDECRTKLPQPAQEIQSAQMISFADDWRLDGDTLRCRKCGFGIISNRASEAVKHGTRCSVSEKFPWASLRNILQGGAK